MDGVASPPTQYESDFLLRRIAEAAKDFPAYATPRAIWWTTEPSTIANGLLTPTLKIKRAALDLGRPERQPQAS
jgi:long-chain acyl-CoA synthetase